ncbi:hypothetical protein AB1Y20_016224 [Prymnesium parvum]|uniref:Uncharacterized protein n=1 Tax=Prymnesium parvum TaxID=97485 RepID=A0AB34IC01_PRYPA
MEWTNSAGQLYTGTSVPAGEPRSRGGAFPEGSVRLKNVGYHDGEHVDLLLTVSTQPTKYSELVSVKYLAPQTAPQAMLTPSGLACVGVGVTRSFCASDAELNNITALCDDGTAPTIRGAEFDVRFVRAGTTVTMPRFGAVHTTFYDVDGVMGTDGSYVREIVSIPGSSPARMAPSTTFRGGVLFASEAAYTIADQSTNVQSKYNDDLSATPSNSLLGIAHFVVRNTSEIKILLGGLSSVAAQIDRQYCFAMAQPQATTVCSPPPVSQFIPAVPPQPPTIPPTPTSPPRAPLASGDCGIPGVYIDFATFTNPDVDMEWTDSAGQTYPGKLIPFGATDRTGGAFPGGHVRWKNVGYDEGVVFDILVTVNQQPTSYSDAVAVEYVSPSSLAATQATLTDSGFACLGFGVRPSFCASSAALDVVRLTCADGSAPTMRAAEFNLRFVHAGSTQTMRPFNTTHATFYDVDGDVVNGRAMYEFASVRDSTLFWLAPTSTLERGEFLPSSATYAIATQSINVATDFNGDPVFMNEASLPAIAHFILHDTSEFSILLGALSSVSSQADRGYCIAMVQPVNRRNMEWTDSAGQTYPGKLIPFGATDRTGGAFPGGHVRWKNVGYDEGVVFDILVTVNQQPTSYSDAVAVEYVSPSSLAATQATLTDSGFACLGFGVRPSFCASSAALDVVRLTCADGSAPTMRAAEFNLRFVHAGSTQTMRPFNTTHATFYDVDGDVVNGRAMYEFASVRDSTLFWLAPTSTLERGEFLPSSATYAIATQSINVATDFNGDPVFMNEASLPAIAHFILHDTSEFSILLGALSSVSSQADRGYCIAMVQPDESSKCSNTSFSYRPRETLRKHHSMRYNCLESQ